MTQRFNFPTAMDAKKKTSSVHAPSHSRYRVGKVEEETKEEKDREKYLLYLPESSRYFGAHSRLIYVANNAGN